MGMNGHLIIATLRLSLQSPRQAARVVIGWPLSAGEYWTFLALTAVLSAVLMSMQTAPTPDQIYPFMEMIPTSPIGLAIFQFAGLVLSALMIFVGGRVFGGTGGFLQGLAVISWLQVMQFVLLLAQIVLMLLLPPLAGLVLLASLALILWTVPNFIAELHGFRSAIATFFGMIATFIVAAVVLSVLIVLLFGPLVA